MVAGILLKPAGDSVYRVDDTDIKTASTSATYQQDPWSSSCSSTDLSCMCFRRSSVQCHLAKMVTGDTTQYNESIDVGLSISELATYFRVTTFTRAVRALVNPLRFFDDPLLTELNVSYS